MEIKTLEQLLIKIKSIKRLSKVLTFLIIIPFVLIFLILILSNPTDASTQAMLSNTMGASTQAKAGSPLALIILICLIILLVKSCSIHFYNIKDYKTQARVRSYKIKAIVCSVLALILIIFFWIMTIIIWVMSRRNDKIFRRRNYRAKRTIRTII